MYCLMSARSMNAESEREEKAVSQVAPSGGQTESKGKLPMACAMFEVDITRTFFLCFNLSSCVRSAFTT
jgi:hypothetical protein